MEHALDSILFNELFLLLNSLNFGKLCDNLLTLLYFDTSKTHNKGVLGSYAENVRPSLNLKQTDTW